MKYNVNDYELIYLIQCHHDWVALEMMFAKYENMIWKNLSTYNVGSKDKDDIFQDCLILLNKAITIFNENRGKTFTRYFELILKREIVYRKNKLPNVLLMDRPELIPGVSYMVLEEEEEFEIHLKTELEKKVYKSYFKEGMKINSIVRDLNVSEKQIYNCIYRIKKKIKDII